jgi:hypothetical protein
MVARRLTPRHAFGSRTSAPAVFVASERDDAGVRNAGTLYYCVLNRFEQVLALEP